ncbi:MAG: 3-deoxy-D-manno-octulosonic acid kinase [Wenzhouxiangella sp.]
MSVSEFSAGQHRILYDGSVLPAISLEWLQPTFWHLRRAVMAELGGRGQALAVQTDVGAAVLRRYLRGGLVARVVRDRYVFTGYQRSRGFREWLLLDRLFNAGLPVPRPLAASCERHGGLYRAGLLTTLIPGAQPLSSIADRLPVADWRKLGATLQAFFAIGLVHADLNANNILHTATGDWYLIDFDRARIVAAPVDPGPMLARLFRSFDKLGVVGERAVLQQTVSLSGAR